MGDVRLQPQLTNYDVDAIWVFNRDRGLIYATHKSGMPPLDAVSLPSAAFDRFDRSKVPVLFYLHSSRGLEQVSAATIGFKLGKKRTSPIYGYFLSARLLSSPYITDMAAVAPQSATPGRELLGAFTPFRGIYARSLCDWRGRQVGQLNLQTDLAFANVLPSPHGVSILVFVVLAVFLLACAFLAIAHWVSLPLRAISQALVTQDVRGLSGLAENETEFGQLAGLVGEFFDQKHRLEGEILERKRAESALQCAHEELEKRVLERTLELRETNQSLNEQITERARAESALQSLRRSTAPSSRTPRKAFTNWVLRPLSQC